MHWTILVTPFNNIKCFFFIKTSESCLLQSSDKARIISNMTGISRKCSIYLWLTQTKTSIDECIIRWAIVFNCVKRTHRIEMSLEKRRKSTRKYWGTWKKLKERKRAQKNVSQFRYCVTELNTLLKIITIIQGSIRQRT